MPAQAEFYQGDNTINISVLRNLDTSAFGGTWRFHNRRSFLPGRNTYRYKNQTVWFNSFQTGKQ
jgi:hypothetical protein